ncbi:response regulator [Shewanella sp. FJAT-51649]|uniref:response regulator n=1 Tax=Shewanella sp. FJAT-51649 TaxID=2864210 RepID=UPI001C6616A7|nr:response regulator [Shewanella sp. FJAT-51649]QYJ71349.1 response regulator [Shewanella sp. FJAT-51649]
MSKASIKICPTLHTILQDESFNNFQIKSLRDAYLAASTSYITVSKTYNFIYQQVHRLVKKGLLDKNVDQQSNETTYQKTTIFFQANFILQDPKKSESVGATLASKQKHNTIKQLEERLKQSEIDLLTSIGESEEYMRLYQSFPEMKAHLESQYLLARETSSKLLGQIKAIKSAITHQQK